MLIHSEGDDNNNNNDDDDSKYVEKSLKACLFAIVAADCHKASNYPFVIFQCQLIGWPVIPCHPLTI